MTPSHSSDNAKHHDPLVQYATKVHELHRKLNQIRSNQGDVAASLGRAAAALRSISEISKQPKSSQIRKEISGLRETHSPNTSCTWGKLIYCPEG